MYTIFDNVSEVSCGLVFFDVQEVNKKHQELLLKIIYGITKGL